MFVAIANEAKKYTVHQGVFYETIGGIRVWTGRRIHNKNVGRIFDHPEYATNKPEKYYKMNNSQLKDLLHAIDGHCTVSDKFDYDFEGGGLYLKRLDDVKGGSILQTDLRETISK